LRIDCPPAYPNRGRLAGKAGAGSTTYPDFFIDLCFMLFGGATGLHAFDLQGGVPHELVAPDRMMRPLCIGDLSRGEILTVDTCNEDDEPMIRDLRNGRVIKIPHPADFPGMGEIGFGKPFNMGVAKFSPRIKKSGLQVCP
jgi:hypothetical protein